MSFANQAYVPRMLMNGLVYSYNQFAGGGAAADCTTSVNDGQISSVAYNASTGKYLVTFANVGAKTTPVAINVSAFGATAKLNVKLDAYSASNKTLVLWIYADTTLADLATTDFLCIETVWCDSTVPVG